MRTNYFPLLVYLGCYTMSCSSEMCWRLILILVGIQCTGISIRCLNGGTSHHTQVWNCSCQWQNQDFVTNQKTLLSSFIPAVSSSLLTASSDKPLYNLYPLKQTLLIQYVHTFVPFFFFTVSLFWSCSQQRQKLRLSCPFFFNYF